MKPRDQIIARMYVVLTLLGILPVMVVWQILGIDIADGPELREKGVMQASSVQSIPAVRTVAVLYRNRSIIPIRIMSV